VRVYRTYKVQILDPDLCKTLLDISGQVSDEELGMRALNNNARRANSVLTLPLDKVRATFLTVPAEKRFNKIEVDHHLLDESVLVVLDDIEVSEYLRL
jgi:hypothetical protein